jgi:cell shape-determining protein MreC
MTSLGDVHELQERLDDLSRENEWLREQVEKQAKALSRVQVIAQEQIERIDDALWTRTSNDTNWEQAS